MSKKNKKVRFQASISKYYRKIATEMKGDSGATDSDLVIRLIDLAMYGKLAPFGVIVKRDTKTKTIFN